MNKLANEINELLLKNDFIKEYLELKKEIENNKYLLGLRTKLDVLRKDICKNKDKDSSEYYDLLDTYKKDARVNRYSYLEKEVKEFLLEISDILSLK